MKRTKQNGITLIALVITIIVLLILAGVTIATLTGDNGILTRANDAKEKTEQAKKEEEASLNSYENQINNYIDKDIIGDYVKYNVQYTDIYYNSYKFDENNGWRILNYSVNSDGTYDIELISTGIPAGFIYNYSNIKDDNLMYDGTTIGKFVGNMEQRQNYINKFGSYNNSTENYNIYVCSRIIL